jgi:hypothetical protein
MTLKFTRLQEKALISLGVFTRLSVVAESSDSHINSIRSDFEMILRRIDGSLTRNMRLRKKVLEAMEQAGSGGRAE